MYTVKITFDALRCNPPYFSQEKTTFQSLDEAKEYGHNRAKRFDLIEIYFGNIILVADMYSNFKYYEKSNPTQQKDKTMTTTNPTQQKDKTMRYTVKIIFNANVSPDVAQFNSLDEAKEYGLNHANTFDLIEIRFRENNRNIILVADMRSNFEFYEV